MADVDNGIHVSVSPSQSAFYAGEPFNITVTFTNTNPPADASSSSSIHTSSGGQARLKRTSSQSHKRAAHSISSAPLARPPTSPVTPRTAVPFLPSYTKSKTPTKDGRGRKGLIGVINSVSEASDDRIADLRDRPKRFLSVDLSASDAALADLLSSVVASPSPRHGEVPSMSPTSGFQRDPSLTLAANHPHARKPSVLDSTNWQPQTQTQTHAEQLQLQLQNMSFTPPPVSTPSVTQSASGSAFSLSLDTIAEGGPGAFSPTSATVDISDDAHSYPPRQTPSGRRQFQGIGLGYGPPPVPPHTAPASSSSFPRPRLVSAAAGTELILYSYAHIVGSLTLSDMPSTSGTSTTSNTHALNAIRSVLSQSQKKVIGGGRMDISSTLSGAPTSSLRLSRPGSRRTSSHSRTASLGSGLLSLLSPSSLLSSSPNQDQQSWFPGHKSRSPSASSSLIPSFLSTSVSAPGAMGSSSNSSSVVPSRGLQADSESTEIIDPETSFPVFEVQPSMLGVDIVLAPGECRSYKYTLNLPVDLPPTYKGRILKFAYHFVVGVCRASPKGLRDTEASSNSSTSRLMRVPIRVYNNVSVSGNQRPYDLLWPVLRSPTKDQPGKVTESTTKKSLNPGSPRMRHASPSKFPPETHSNAAALASLREYSLRLLASLPVADGSLRHPLTLPHVSPTGRSDDDEVERHFGDRNTGELSGCREAVEVLTRTMRKVSYDVTKDGVTVAVLTFTKSAYRLGETIVGIVEINDRASRARVLKLSAVLEAHESLPPTLSSSGKNLGKKMRKVHAEAHYALTPSTLRTSFSLDIPSDATPAFQCTCSSLDPLAKQHTGQGFGGLEWKVRLCLLVSVASPYAHEGYDGIRVKHVILDGDRGEWGSAWRATKGIAPLQKINSKKAAAAAAIANVDPQSQNQKRGWTSYLLSSLLSGEREYHDGDEDVESDGEEQSSGEGITVDPVTGEVDVGGGERGWSEIRVEMVECEVPIGVWPGNTAYKPMEVVFDV